MVEIIAEFGANWNNMRTFREMVLICKDIGIKYIKLQMFEIDKVPKEIRKMWIGKGRAKYMFKFAKSLGIELFFTPMYPEAVDILEEIGVNYYKIRYIDRYNWKLYKKIKKTGKLTFVSVDDRGIMQTLYSEMFMNNPTRIIPLLCVPDYPAEFEQYNPHYIVIGYSDHTPDFQLYNWAKNFSEFIEMHVYLDKDTAYEAKWSKSFKDIKERILEVH